MKKKWLIVRNVTIEEHECTCEKWLLRQLKESWFLNPKVSHLARFLGLFGDFQGCDWLVVVRPPKLNYGTSTTGMAGGYKREENGMNSTGFIIYYMSLLWIN